MNSEGDDPRERPATIVARLARRAEGLARWHDAAIGEDWRALGEVWASLDYDAGGLHAGRVDRHAGRANRNFDVATVGGVMIVAGLPPPLQALLAIGESMHVGKGAAEGFGRYRLDWVPARGAV